MQLFILARRYITSRTNMASVLPLRRACMLITVGHTTSSLTISMTSKHCNPGGNGAHMHISVHSTKDNVSVDASSGSDASLGPTLTPTERSFLQALLEHLPALCALILPTSASYARVMDGIWSGGTYACWGTDNKDAPIRLCGPQGGHNFELKSSDATANPYLVLAGVIAAGLDGVLQQAQLKIGDCVKPAAQMSEAEMKAVGLENPGRLPRTLEDAREVFGADGLFRKKFGDELMTKYLSVNEVSLVLNVIAIWI